MPSTYQYVEEKGVTRNIGKLRRLILLPAELQITGYGPVLATLGSEVKPNRLLDDFARISADYLVNAKGYELATLQAGTSATSSKAVYEDIKSHVRVLLNWAAESPDGADPPDEVVIGAKTLGDLANVDGILLLQGWGKALSDEAYLAVLLTASLAWPVIFAETKVSISADLFESSSGRIVWRSRATSTNQDHLGDIRFLVWDLFEPVEEALPSILIIE